MSSAFSLPLAGATVSWLHQDTIERALAVIADNGLRSVEICTMAPHLQTTALGGADRRQLRRRLDQLGLAPLSINPSGLDLNPASPHNEVRDLTERLLVAELELAADLEAPFVVAATGRLHALAPLPVDEAFQLVAQLYRRLADRAARLGPTLLVETVPYGFLTSGSDVLGLVEEVDSPQLGVLYDVANVLAFEDPSEGLRAVADRLRLVHVSDSRYDRWSHQAPGRGEIDFAAVAHTLRTLVYDGPTVYELLDGTCPTDRYGKDVDALVAAGWSR